MKYQVLVNGSNYLIEMDKGTNKYGFFQTLYVEQNDIEAAKDKALKIIQNDRTFNQTIKNKENDPPRLNIEEIEEIEALQENTLGRSFYIEKKLWQFWK